MGLEGLQYQLLLKAGNQSLRFEGASGGGGNNTSTTHRLLLLLLLLGRSRSIGNTPGDRRTRNTVPPLPPLPPPPLCCQSWQSCWRR